MCVCASVPHCLLASDLLPLADESQGRGGPPDSNPGNRGRWTVDGKKKKKAGSRGKSRCERQRTKRGI